MNITCIKKLAVLLSFCELELKQIHSMYQREIHFCNHCNSLALACCLYNKWSILSNVFICSLVLNCIASLSSFYLTGLTLMRSADVCALCFMCHAFRNVLQISTTEFLSYFFLAMLWYFEIAPSSSGIDCDLNHLLLHSDAGFELQQILLTVSTCLNDLLPRDWLIGFFANEVFYLANHTNYRGSMIFNSIYIIFIFLPWEMCITF